MSSNRYGESRLAYREVQARHDDIKKIEKTLTELAQLFSDVRIHFCFGHTTFSIGIDLTMPPFDFSPLA